MMNAIDALFQQLRAEGRKAFIPFLTGGDPDTQSTIEMAKSLIEAGANLIEIGFPYSDAIADGPVIQASYTRALNNGLKIDDVFSCISNLAQSDIVQEKKIPLVGMVSYSLVHRRSPESFLDRAVEAGLSGVIVPDLPFEESQGVRKLALDRNCKLIQLVTPTTPPVTAVEIAQATTGFLYCVSVTGITGEHNEIPESLKERLDWLRQQTEVPLCVGFGISRPEQVQMLREHVDGVIVGSALVRRMESIGKQTFDEVKTEIIDLTKSLVGAL